MARLLGEIQRFLRRPRPVEGPGLGEELVYYRHALDLLELDFSELAGGLAAGDLWEAQGSTTAIDWLRHNCKMSGHSAAERVAVGEHRERLPQSVMAMEEGRIGFAHLVLLARTADAVERSTTGQGFEETALLQQAEGMSVGKFRHACFHARHALDQEGVIQDEVDQVLRRELTMTQGENGMYFLHGRLDSEGGATLRTALEPLARESGKDDVRHRQRRWGDALIELARQSLDMGQLPRKGGQRPHVMITASVETLLGLAGCPGAEMEFSRPLSVEALRRLTCDCSITRILLGPDSVPINVGRAWRTISPSQYKALVARDKHCRWPGCERPAAWCEGHHTIPWALGGGTDLKRLMLVCNRHHWMLHQGGWQLIKTGDGRMLTIPGKRDHYYQWAYYQTRGPDRKVAA